MSLRQTFPTFLLSIGLAVWLTSCKGASTSCNPTDPLCNGEGGGTLVPTTVNVSPTAVTFTQLGETQQLTATVLDQNGDPLAPASVSWSSMDESVATVSASGLLLAEGSGTTTIEATSGSAKGSADVSVDDPCTPLEVLAVLAATSGTLSETDCPLGGGSFGDVWALTIEQDDEGTVQIDLLSADFDAYLFLLDDDGVVLSENDDAHVTGLAAYDLSSHVIEDLSPGTYSIVVTSFTGNETGAYVLQVGPGLRCPEIGHIAVGGVVFGSLESTDCSYGVDGFYADPYVVEVTTTDELTFHLASIEFDTYLSLLGPAGHFLLDDDDSGGGPSGTDSHFNVSLAPGFYVIEVSSFSGGEVGAYTLDIQN